MEDLAIGVDEQKGFAEGVMFDETTLLGCPLDPGRELIRAVTEERSGFGARDVKQHGVSS